MIDVNYRILSDDDLANRCRRDGDVFARDLLQLRKWKNGDRNSGMTLLDQYKNLYYRVCQRFGVKDREEVVEIYQDVVVDLLEQLEKLPGRIEKSFAGFFCWRVRKAIQKRWKKKPTADISLLQPASEGETIRIDEWEAIENCWKKLPGKQYTIFELRYIQEMSLDEIAMALESNVNAVGQNIFKLSRKMRECLKKTAA